MAHRSALKPFLRANLDVLFVALNVNLRESGAHSLRWMVRECSGYSMDVKTDEAVDSTSRLLGRWCADGQRANRLLRESVGPV
jgi:hypothetical protein